MKEKELHIDAVGIKKAAFLVRAVNHPVRQAILQEISRAGEITVTDLQLKLKMIQPVASSHLAVLRKANVVTTKREGKQILYSVRYDRVALLNQKIKQLLK